MARVTPSVKGAIAPSINVPNPLNPVSFFPNLFDLFGLAGEEGKRIRLLILLFFLRVVMVLGGIFLIILGLILLLRQLGLTPSVPGVVGKVVGVAA